MDDNVNSTGEDFLAEVVARYEESLAGGGQTNELDLTPIASDPDLYERWQGVKDCLELLHRLQPVIEPTRLLTCPPAAESFPNKIESSLISGFGLPSTLGRFQIERLLGAGGVGLVYLALDPQLGRRVALKVPRLETLANDDLRNRFLREAEAAARLSHPNLVPLLEFGQDDLLCYIAAEYCRGPTLAEWIRDQQGNVPVRLAATIVRQLSDAVQHAHGRGVLHRDIKPGNVLIVAGDASDSSGSLQSLVPKLTDFGMAKLSEHAGCDETHTGATIGTPAYMAPEQAAGRVREIDSRTDVYALGAVLYELLTGVAPFRGETPIDILRSVLDKDPPPIRRQRSDVPIDLEAICLKCLSKQPGDRYPTAQQLADDLGRFLAHESVQARRPGLVEGLWKRARRHPLEMGAAAVVAGALIVLTVVTSVYNARLSAAVTRADAEVEAGRRLNYAANVQLAQQSLNRNNVPQTLELLASCVPKPGQQDLREFSWHFLNASCNQQILTLSGHQGDVFSVCYSPDGTTLATTGKDRTVRLWDAATGKPFKVLRDHSSEVTCAAFSPLDELLATGSEDHTIRLWDWRGGTLHRVLNVSSDHVLAIAYSPDGRLLASGGREAMVRVWRVADGTLFAELPVPGDTIHALQFVCDGKRLLAGGEGGRLHQWQVDDWSSTELHSHGYEKFFAIAATHKPSLVVAAGRREEIYFYSDDGTQLQPLGNIADAHLGWIQALAFSPSKPVLASAGKDGVIRLWTTDSQSAARTLVGHTTRIWSLAWSPDGTRLASASADGDVRVWDSVRSPIREYPLAPITYAGVADMDQHRVMTCSAHGELKLWNGPDEVVGEAEREGHKLTFTCEFSPDRRRMALVTHFGQVEVWDCKTLKNVWRSPPTGDTERKSLAWSRDGKYLASGNRRGMVMLHEAETGFVLKRQAISPFCWDLEFLPDGALLISTGRELRIWDHASSKVRWTWPEAHELAASADGRYVATHDGVRISILDAATGKLLHRLVPQGQVHELVISPDNRTLAVGVNDPGQVEMWDLLTGRALISIPIAGAPPLRITFSRDGERLLIAGTPQQNRGQIFELATTTLAEIRNSAP